MRLLLISNSGRPLLHHCRSAISDFLGPVRRVGYITAARMDNAAERFRIAAEALSEVGIDAEHLQLDGSLRRRIEAADSIFVGGGNTYALLQRLREGGVLDSLANLVRSGLPYIGTSAGSNIAGPNILATNDWNVVGCTRFDAMGLVPWAINPHYLEADPTRAPGSETREQRISEYLTVNANPVLGIEESAAIRVENGVATVVGSGRAKLFRRQQAPCWLLPGEIIPSDHHMMEGTT
jgi:dipeptidase E